MIKKILFLILPILVLAQSSKVSLDHSVYDNWKTLNRAKISDDGKWITYEVAPQKGDGYLYLYNVLSKKLDSVSRGYSSSFTADIRYLVFRIKPQEKVTRKAKVDKKKADEMPKDTLAIMNLETGKIKKISNLNTFKIPEEKNCLIVFTSYFKDTTKTVPAKKDTATKKIKPFKSKFDEVKTSNLNIYDPVNENTTVIKDVADYDIAKDGNLIMYSVFKKSVNDSTYLYIFDKNSKSKSVFSGYGIVKKLSVDDYSTRAAFIYSSDTNKIKRYSLHLFDNKSASLLKIADTSTNGIPVNWEISENASLQFSKSAKKLYFGTAPKLKIEPKDTLLEDEKCKVDVWNWQDSRLQTEQLNTLEKDKKRSWLALYDIEEKKVFQLADTLIDNISLIKKGDADIALGISTSPYNRIASWEQAAYKDVYTVNLKTGIKNKVIEKIKFDCELSPEGKYIVYYDHKTKTWNSYSTTENKSYSLTKNVKVSFADEDNDIPNDPEPYGKAVFGRNDEYVLVYDRYDIWKLSTDNKFVPEILTKGRIKKDIYRYIKTDDEKTAIEKGEALLLHSQNIDEAEESYSYLNINSKKVIPLVQFKNIVILVSKAKNAKDVIFTKQSYTDYPDLYLSDTTFSAYSKISNTNPQQSKYLWGTVEFFKWKTQDGKEQKGLLYKPENFDANKKYPTIVYYYEKYSEKYNLHYVPNPSRSVINFPLYNSNGYVVFIPDISYTVGKPGKSAYNIITSGAKALIKQGYIDKEHIGLQGQSWGGYQTAYMVTQTNMFRAAMAGAPVSNMTSAYGGIRWESGMNRIFQYEQGQSRIGGTLWDKLPEYIANSPLFFANKVETPLLIMANDSDGAVPWQEGIQYFVALRRLNKPVWLLNYNGDEHNLVKRPNRQDLSVRMMQFFDHFLKDKPAPKWMSEGIKALEKGKINGY